MNHDLELDPVLTPEQEALVAKLSPDVVEEIDRHIVSECIAHGYKVARVAGRTLTQFREWHPGLPDVFYSGRVRALVKNGKLESQGNLQRMRYSEVRLPGGFRE